MDESPRLGKAYPFINTEVTDTLMRNFARANDYWNPLWHDEKYARYTRWGGIVAHPMYSSAIFYSPPFPSLAVPPEIGVKFGKVWWEETRHYREWRAGDSVRIWIMRPELEDVTGTGGDETRIFKCTSAIKYINQRDEVCDYRSRTMLITILPELPANAAPRIAPGYRYTDEDIELINRMGEEEVIRGRKIRFWEDVQEGESLPPTIYGPITPFDSMLGCAGVGATCIPMREVRRLTPDATFSDPVTNVSHKEIEIHVSDEAARLVSGRPIGVGYEVLLCRTVTNWMGDDGQYRFLKWRNYGAMEMGITILCKGKVLRKYEEDGEHRVDILNWLESIKGPTTAAGVTTIALLYREDVKLNSDPNRI